MGGFWIFLGQWIGGILAGIIAPIIGGITGSLGALGGIANGLLVAYGVGWVGQRFGGHGELMAAGAFAGSVGGAIGGVLGGVGSLFGGGGGGAQIAAGPVAPTGSPGNQQIPTPPQAPGLPAATTQQTVSNVVPIKAGSGG